jgi:hypothetical protein
MVNKLDQRHPAPYGDSISLTSLPELSYWMRRLRASSWQLRNAVTAVGCKVEDVQQFLRSGIDSAPGQCSQGLRVGERSKSAQNRGGQA